jgi:hypothetical protein
LEEHMLYVDGEPYHQIPSIIFVYWENDFLF